MTSRAPSGHFWSIVSKKRQFYKLQRWLCSPWHYHWYYQIFIKQKQNWNGTWFLMLWIKEKKVLSVRIQAWNVIKLVMHHHHFVAQRKTFFSQKNCASQNGYFIEQKECDDTGYRSDLVIYHSMLSGF